VGRLRFALPFLAEAMRTNPMKQQLQDFFPADMPMIKKIKNMITKIKNRSFAISGSGGSYPSESQDCCD
jgi:hypothetical protein